jgi:hypothetical protein
VDGIAPIPARVSNQFDAALNETELGKWLGILLDRWEQQGHRAGRSRRTLLYQQALALACRLADAASCIADVVAHPNTAVDPDGLHTDRLASLYAYLLAPTADVVGPRPSGFEVLARMLRLDVVQLAYEGASQDVEQEVELIKFAHGVPSASPDCKCTTSEPSTVRRGG